MQVTSASADIVLYFNHNSDYVLQMSAFLDFSGIFCHRFEVRKGISMVVATKKAAPRAYSRYCREALAVLGQFIRINRIERRLSVEELATRVGVSRDLMHRIERGDPRCGIGLVFEAAVIVGVPLFESDRSRLSERKEAQSEKLSLLPKAIHKQRNAVKDDF